MKYSVVVPAAGQGKRMRTTKNKQFLLLEGKPVIACTLEVFQGDPWCQEIIVVANATEIKEMKELAEAYEINKLAEIISGGKERQNSVYNGLKAVKDSETVLIHDGARPFVMESLIHKLVLEATQTGAAILAVPVKDTVKASIDTKVARTVDRTNLWSVQTPQAFSLQNILKAHEWAEQNNFLGTDDASLLEQRNEPVSIVLGDYFNIKLTTPEDLVFARSILRVKRGEE